MLNGGLRIDSQCYFFFVDHIRIKLKSVNYLIEIIIEC